MAYESVFDDDFEGEQPEPLNPYSSPAAFGLTPIGTIDVAGSYEFNMLAVWADTTGGLAWARDSGCSCPSPFESTTFEDVTFGSLSELQAALEGHLTGCEFGGREIDVVRGEVVDLIHRVLVFQSARRAASSRPPTPFPSL